MRPVRLASTKRDVAAGRYGGARDILSLIDLGSERQMSEDPFGEELLDVVPDGDRVQVYARRDDLSVSGLVVAAVAVIDGTDPGELTELAAVVDPDALDRLFETGGTTSGFVRFEFAGHEVTVHGDAHLTVR